MLCYDRTYKRTPSDRSPIIYIYIWIHCVIDLWLFFRIVLIDQNCNQIKSKPNQTHKKNVLNTLKKVSKDASGAGGIHVIFVLISFLIVWYMAKKKQYQFFPSNLLNIINGFLRFKNFWIQCFNSDLLVPILMYFALVNYLTLNFIKNRGIRFLTVVFSRGICMMEFLKIFFYNLVTACPVNPIL